METRLPEMNRRKTFTHENRVYSTGLQSGRRRNQSLGARISEDIQRFNECQNANVFTVTLTGGGT